MNKHKRFLLFGLIVMILILGTSCRAGNDEKKALSYTPTPEFWEEFDAKGITDEMIENSVNENGNYAQYLAILPEIESPEEAFDFFSVEFCTDVQTDATYWSLANWEMDDHEYMIENGYTEAEYIGAYGGLQDVVDHTTTIMSMWETYYKRDGKEVFTLLPECIYPKNSSTYFDNEGSGTSFIAPFEWEAGTWYRYVLRSWQADDTTYVGSWLEDLSTHEVSLLAVYDTFLPKSYIWHVPFLFLENYLEDYYGEYRQMKLRNFCIRGLDTQEWYFADKVTFLIYTERGHNQGTYRYRVEGDTVIGETCGLGENVCEGQSHEDTEWVAEITPAREAPDPDRYELPKPLDSCTKNS